jgi:hypothetical protein
MTTRPKRPRDLNLLARQIVEEATGTSPPQEPPANGSDPRAAALGRNGGLKGGRARAEGLSAEQRSDIARKAAQARWHKS